MKKQSDPKMIAVKVLLRVREVASFLGVSESFVRSLIRSGKLKHKRLNRVILIARTDLLEVVK